jgi:acyl-CoA synthetase (AMP-forming)/AMP-acid ligase II
MNLADRLEYWADTLPHAVAIHDRGGLVSYALLDRGVWRAAAALRRAGIAPGQVVGLSFTTSSALYLVAVYALARIGAIELVLPLRNPASSRASLARHFKVAAIIADDGQPAVADLPVIRAEPEWLAPGPGSTPRGPRFEGDDAPWLINLSSGTTGMPKAIHRSHRDQRFLEERALQHAGDTPDDRFLVIVQLSFSYGLNTAMQVLYGGGLLRMTRPDLTDAQLYAIIDRDGINRLAMTPTHAQAMLPAMSEDAPRFPRIRRLEISTAAVPDALRREIRRRITPNLHIRYAANETSCLTGADPRAQIDVPDTVGRPYPGISVAIVDEAGAPLPPGETGRLRFRGAGLPSAYIDNPEASARAFHDGWFEPGDLGALTPSGALMLKGRADDMMSVGGVKVFPAEIESVLCQHPAVAEAAAFPVASGYDRDLPAAAVVLRGDTTAEELLAFCRDRLDFRAPKAVHIVPALPRNAIGKILRRELARTFTS